MEFKPEEAMRLPTVLSALALILALMQGVISLESTAPARISLLKARLLLSLEFAELAIVLISEVFTFVGLRSALKGSLKWLHWLPPAILALGMCELVIDGFFTFRAVTFSRTLWVPLSALGGSDGLAQVFELGCLFITGSLSIALVGWRQAFWWRSNFVPPQVAVDAAVKDPWLSSIAWVLCLAFALIVVAIPTILAAVVCVRAILSFGGEGEYKAVWTMRQPNMWQRGSKAPVNYRRRRQYELLFAIMRGEEPRTDMAIDEALGKMPLHIGNTVIGADCSTIADRKIVRRVRWQHCVVTILKQVAVIPFLIIVVATLYRMHTVMDREMYAVFEELADAATVVVLQELGVGLKSFIWKLRGAAGDRDVQSEIELLAYKKFDGDDLE